MYTPYHYLLAITRLNKDCEKKMLTPQMKSDCYIVAIVQVLEILRSSVAYSQIAGPLPSQYEEYSYITEFFYMNGII